uniref:aldolase/citrate lyase family protein n=1 Tax=Limnohabitans sp. TaxID=1907725 RepID=UPI00404884BB
MQIKQNNFKRAIKSGKHQKGLWTTLANSYSTEVVAGAGFDWLLLDMEHSPNDTQTILHQLQTIAAYPVAAVVRPAWNDPIEIKKLLDIGVQNFLIPYVQNPAEAEQAVKSVRYPPRGIRGVSALTRATNFGRVIDYMKSCEKEICVLVQVETQDALYEISGIAAIDGVDGIFIGPGDLSASLGFPGQLKHPTVLEAIDRAMLEIKSKGVAPGILTGDKELARHYIELGSMFTAVGVDAGLLARAADSLAKEF